MGEVIAVTQLVTLLDMRFRDILVCQLINQNFGYYPTPVKPSAYGVIITLPVGLRISQNVFWSSYLVKSFC